ncbi:hypothetical protein N7468_001447 [Penicillium chermesinum]|uniref:Uncharacterized protein n=1 Tax=Penicillium chermesinum TaxID=63820 RepID=A0A9W9PGT8_9EURO|nr:uncharacterized protein N7468_001447 [Penicillium chermesinum]KAJ5246464.1 hypothetical protein N7468_001447 [Penicillium chermesinum]
MGAIRPTSATEYDSIAPFQGLRGVASSPMIGPTPGTVFQVHRQSSTATTDAHEMCLVDAGAKGDSTDLRHPAVANK